MISAGDASRNSRSSSAPAKHLARRPLDQALDQGVHWPALSEWRNCMRRVSAVSAAVAGRLVEHRIALGGRGKGLGVAGLLHFKSVEAGAQHEHELVAQHLSGGAQFAAIADVSRATAAPGCRRGRRGSSETPARPARAGRDRARVRRHRDCSARSPRSCRARRDSASASARNRAAGISTAPSAGSLGIVGNMDEKRRWIFFRS